MSTVSIAIETSCRCGGVALGFDNQLVQTIDFDSSSRHATHLVARLNDLLQGQNLRPADIHEIYVSAGPGSFTGVRIGVTVARTLAQALPQSRCVSVPSALAVAFNARALPCPHLAVILDAKDDLVYAQLFAPSDHSILAAADPIVTPLADFIAAAPKPLTLIGEGLLYHAPAPTPGVELADPSLYYPTAEGAWLAGRQLSRDGKFIDFNHLLPIYARKSEAERLWELKHPQQSH